jgi:predicted nucleotidyltransferase
MDRQYVIKALKAHEPELRAGGVEALYLFGSTARDEAKPESDVVTLPRQTGPDVKFEHHLEEGHDEEDAEAVYGRVQGSGGCPVG